METTSARVVDLLSHPYAPLVIALAAMVVTFTLLSCFWRAGRPRRALAGERVAVLATIGTNCPPWTADATFLSQVSDAMGYTPKIKSLVDKIVSRSGIEQRHTLAAEHGPNEFVARLEKGGYGRSSLWEEWAPRMAVNAARDALAQWQWGAAADVTHVVTHSCTGFTAPGLDFHLITELGLRRDTRKLAVNYMGCFGGFTALYVAKQIVEADPTGRAVVLIACSEVCSIHVSRDQRVELVIGNTLFADGSAAAIVTHAGFRGAGARRPASASAVPREEWALGAMSSDIIPGSAGAMTWKQGATSGQYDMWLDKSIPGALSSLFLTRGLSMLATVGIPSAWACAWAIHPGGKAIIQAFSDAFATLRINPEGLSCSADVLRTHGNMSSPTIFFVLQRVLAATQKPDIFCAGFGPGLTIEFGRLYRVVTEGSSGATSAVVAAAGSPLPPLESASAVASLETEPSTAPASRGGGSSSSIGSSSGISAQLHVDAAAQSQPSLEFSDPVPSSPTPVHAAASPRRQRARSKAAE